MLSITSAPLVFALETGNGVNLPPGGKAPPVVRPAVQTRGAGSHRSSTVNRSLRKIEGLSSSYLKCSWFLLFLHRVSARGAWSQRERSAATQLLTCGHFVLARIRGGIKAKSSPCGKQSVGIGRLGPPRFGTNLNRSAVIGFSNPNSLVCTLAVRAFREGQEGTKFARGTVSVKPSKRVGVHPCPGRRRRHPRGGGAALRPRLCRWVCRTQGATRASRGRPPFAAGRDRRPNSPGARELVLAGWFLEVRRVGEAAHPGPEPGLQVFQDWRSANITGFCHRGSPRTRCNHGKCS